MSFTYLSPNNYQSPSYTASSRRSQSINSNKNPQLISSTYQNQKNINNNNENDRKSLQFNNLQKNKTYHERTISSNRQQNPSLKLSQMSSDLARLKQQLNKIMNQADKFSNNNVNINPSFNTEKSIPKHQFTYNNQQTKKINNNNYYNQNYSTNYLNSSRQISKTPVQKANPSQQIFNFESYLSNKTPKIVNNSFSQKNIITYGLNEKKNIDQDNLYENYNRIQNKSYQNNSNNKIDNLSFMNYKPILKIKQQLNKIQPKKQQSNKIQPKQQQLNKIQKQIYKIPSLTNIQKIQQLTYIQKKSQNYLDNSIKSDLYNSIKSYKPFESIITQSVNNNNINNNSSIKLNDNQQQTILIINKASSIQNKMISSQYHIQISSIKQTRQVNEIKSNYLDLTKKYSQNSQSQRRKSNLLKETFQFQQKIIQLQHDKRKMKHQINNLLLEKENFQIMLNTEKTQKQNLLKKYYQIQLSLKENKLQLQQYKDKCRTLQRKLQIQLSRKSNKNISKVQNSFDQVLKDQIIQINKYKQKLQQKDEQINRLKDLNTNHRRQIDSLNNQIKIQQLKGTSQLKQANQKHSITLEDKQNQLKTYKNLILTLQSKLQVAVNQNKTKDNFLVQHLTGKVKSGQEKQYIQNFFKKYAVQFPVNRISQKIRQEQIQIEKLKQTIFQLASKQL